MSRTYSNTLSFRAVVAAVVFAAIGCLSLASIAQANILFSEDFEALTPGVALSGQGGWTVAPSNAPVGPANLGLATQTLSGSDILGGLAIGGINRPLGFSLDGSLSGGYGKYSLVFDAFATATAPASNGASLFGFTEAGFGETLYWNTTGGTWRFGTRDLVSAGTTVIGSVTGGFDTAIRLRIDVDGVSNLIEGFYDFGTGWTSVGSLGITDLQIADIDGIGGLYDNRSNFRFFDVDNITLSNAIPEPSTIVMLGMGLVGLATRRRRRLAS